MKKITAKVKAAYAREEMVRNAKNKKTENLTIEEAREIIKWDKERDRNTAIAGLAVAAISTGLWMTILKEEQHDISEFEKYQKEYTK